MCNIIFILRVPQTYFLCVVVVEKMADEASRLEELPAELKGKIFRMISSPKDIDHLLAVNRSIAASAIEYSIPTIESLSIHIAGGGGSDGGPNLINREAIHPQKVIHAIKHIWKYALNIKTLKMTGRLSEVGWLGGNKLIFDVVKELMISDPRALQEMSLHIDVRRVPEFYLDEISPVNNILYAVSGSLEKFECFVRGISANLFLQRIFSNQRIFSSLSLGSCSHLKEIYLNKVHFNTRNGPQYQHQREAARIICLNKTELSSIVFHFDNDMYGTDSTLLGVLDGIDANITHLNVELSKFFPFDGTFTLATDKIFPQLTNLTFTMSVHDVQYLDIRGIQLHLSTFLHHFPALEYVRIKNKAGSVNHLIEGISHVVSFFERVLPTIPEDVQERKFRVSKFSHV